MARRDPRIDAYTARSPVFARLILAHLRSLVHKACPGVEETMKWSFPNFVYHGILCSMAGFKEHCSVGFWKASRIPDPRGYLSRSHEGMGSFGKITRFSDLPPDRVLMTIIRHSAKLNKAGVKPVRAEKPAATRALRIPPDLKAALGREKKARATFEGFSPTNKREYVDWIIDARTEATRRERVSKAISWMRAGKPRNWKYMK